MNWEMLAALGQLAAVFVGIPSLIYLAVQIRAQTKERRQSAVNALAVQWGDLTCALHESAELSAIFLRGVQSFADLDPVSKLRFSAFLNTFLNHFEAMYFAHSEGFTHGIGMGQDRADAERCHCLSRHSTMVGRAKTLAHGRVWPHRRRDYRQRR
jgi:hypothetical protein